MDSSPARLLRLARLVGRNPAPLPGLSDQGPAAVDFNGFIEQDRNRRQLPFQAVFDYPFQHLLDCRILFVVGHFSSGVLVLASVRPKMVIFGSWQGPERVFNRRNSPLFRGLETRENAAGGQKVPFMDGH